MCEKITRITAVPEERPEFSGGSLWVAGVIGVAVWMFLGRALYIFTCSCGEGVALVASSFALAAAIPAMLLLIYLQLPRGGLSAKIGLCRMNRADWLWALGAFGLYTGLSFPLTWVWQCLLERAHIGFAEEQSLVSLMRCAPVAEKLGMIFAVLVLVPFFEELLFRRMLYGLLVKFLSRNSAILLGAAAFAGVHLFILGLPSLAMLAVILQLAFLRRRNLWVAVAVHFMVNLTAVIMVFCT